MRDRFSFQHGSARIDWARTRMCAVTRHARVEFNTNVDDLLFLAESRIRQHNKAVAILHFRRNLGLKGEFTTMSSEEHTSELQSLMRTSYAVFCLKKKNRTKNN